MWLAIRGVALLLLLVVVGGSGAQAEPHQVARLRNLVLGGHAVLGGEQPRLQLLDLEAELGRERLRRHRHAALHFCLGHLALQRCGGGFEQPRRRRIAAARGAGEQMRHERGQVGEVCLLRHR